MSSIRRQHRRFQPYLSAPSSSCSPSKGQQHQDGIDDGARRCADSAAGQQQQPSSQQLSRQCARKRPAAPAEPSSSYPSSPVPSSPASSTCDSSSSSSVSSSQYTPSDGSSSSTATTPSLCHTGSTHAASSVGSPSLTPPSSSLDEAADLKSVGPSTSLTLAFRDGEIKGAGIVASTTALKPVGSHVHAAPRQPCPIRSNAIPSQTSSRGKHGLDLVDRTVRALFEMWPVLLHQEAHAARRSSACTSASAAAESVESDIKPPSTLSANCGSGALPIKVFVHELLRRSKSSGAILQTALCYLEAYKTARQRPQQPTQVQSTVTIMTADELIQYELGQLDATPADKFPAGSLEPAESRGSPLDPLGCPRRTFLAALLLAQKFTSDRGFSNKAWAKLTGLTPLEVGRCERALGESLDWRLWVGKPVTQVSAATRELSRAQTLPSIAFGSPLSPPPASPFLSSSSRRTSSLSRSISVQDLAASSKSSFPLECPRPQVTSFDAMDVVLDARSTSDDAPFRGADVDMSIAPLAGNVEASEEVQATIQVNENRTDFGEESDSCDTPCPLRPPSVSAPSDEEDEEVDTPPTPALTMTDSPPSVTGFTKSMTDVRMPMASTHRISTLDTADGDMLVDTSLYSRSKSGSHLHLSASAHQSGWMYESTSTSTSDWVSSLPPHHVYAAA